jgi:hypothetical protein
MAIYRLLQNAAFGPEEISCMTAAYEAALVELKLSDRSAPITQTIAKRIVEFVKIGERDPVRLSELALQGLRLHVPDVRRSELIGD